MWRERRPDRSVVRHAVLLSKRLWHLESESNWCRASCSSSDQHLQRPRDVIIEEIEVRRGLRLSACPNAVIAPAIGEHDVIHGPRSVAMPAKGSFPFVGKWRAASEAGVCRVSSRATLKSVCFGRRAAVDAAVVRLFRCVVRSIRHLQMLEAKRPNGQTGAGFMHQRRVGGGSCVRTEPVSYSRASLEALRGATHSYH